ncbi:MAG: tetratricopeptide repeat protein [Sphingomonadales bacterium]|nr:tetratricopeptide repeat protein [Sphingomonadales bacterium]
MKKLLFTLAAAGACLLQAQSIEQGKRQTRNEQYEDAAKTFDALIAKKPKVGEHYYWAGINFLESGDTASAKEMFEKGLLMMPKYTLNNVGMGHLALRQGNAAAAESQFAIARKSGKKLMPIINREIGRAYLMVQYAAPATLKEYTEKAEASLKLVPETDYEAQLLLGDAYLIMIKGDASISIEKYTISGYLNESDPRAKLRQGMVYQRVGNYDVALNQVNDALNIDKDFAPAYRQKADIFNLMKKRDSTVFYYKEYLKRNNNISARKMYAQALFLAADYDEAIAESKSILDQQQKTGAKLFTNLYGVIAYSYAQKNDTARAVNQAGLDYFELYEAKHVKNLNRPLSLQEKFIKANLLGRLGQGDVAFDIHMSVISDTARCPAIWYHQLQDYYTGRKQWNRAVSVIEWKRIKNNGLENKDLFYLGNAQLNASQYQKAIGTYTELIGKDSTAIQGYYKIAQSYDQLDPTDSLGKATEAYLVWMKRLNAEQKTKYKQTMLMAYNFMQTAARGRKQWDKCSEFLGKMMELAPEDENIKKDKEAVDNYIKKQAARQQKKPAKPGAKP